MCFLSYAVAFTQAEMPPGFMLPGGKAMNCQISELPCGRQSEVSPYIDGTAES